MRKRTRERAGKSLLLASRLQSLSARIDHTNQLLSPKEKRCAVVESNHKQHNAQTSKKKRTIRQSLTARSLDSLSGKSSHTLGGTRTEARVSNKETHHQTTTRQRHSWCRSRNKNLLRKNQATQQHQEDLNLCNLALTRGFKGPLKRKPHNHNNNSPPFCNNHHSQQRACHSSRRSRARKTRKEKKKNFFSSTLFELANAQPTSPRHPFPSFRINIKHKNFRACVLSQGRKRRRRDDRRKSFFEILILASFFLLLLVNSLRLLENTEQFRFLF